MTTPNHSHTVDPPEPEFGPGDGVVFPWSDIIHTISHITEVAPGMPAYVFGDGGIRPVREVDHDARLVRRNGRNRTRVPDILHKFAVGEIVVQRRGGDPRGYEIESVRSDGSYLVRPAGGTSGTVLAFPINVVDEGWVLADPQPTTLDLVQELYQAVHGDLVALPSSPAQVWGELISAVREMRRIMTDRKLGS